MKKKNEKSEIVQKKNKKKFIKEVYEEKVAPQAKDLTSSNERIIDRKDLVIALSIFALSMLVYILTLAPSVFSGDCGEFATAAYHLGIVHPPGYPLYCLLGRAFQILIPFGDMAYRINLMSALFSALSAVMIYFCGKIIIRERLSAILASIIAAFSATIWSQAVISEVYTMAGFFFAAILFLTLYWFHKKSRKVLYLLAFTCGLALTHHITIAAFYPIIAVFILVTEFKIIKDWKFLIKAIILFLLPLLFYLYLPLRSAANPPTDWGNPETFKSVVDHVTAKQYRGKLLEYGFDGFIFQIQKFFHTSLHEFTPPIIILVLLGIIIGFRYQSKNTLFLLLLIIINLFYSALYFIVDIEAYFIPAFLILSIFIALALYSIRRAIVGSNYKKTVNYIATGTVIFVAIIPLIFNWRKNDRSGNYIPRNYGINILKSISKDGIFFSHGDNESFILAYLQLVENMRPDAKIYDRTQNILPYPKFKEASEDNPVYANEIADYEKDVIENTNTPVYYNTNFEVKYPTMIHGVIFRVIRDWSEYDEKYDPWDKYDLSEIDDPRYAKDFMTKVIINQYYSMRAKFLKQYGKQEEADKLIEKTLNLTGDIPDTLVIAAYYYMETENWEKAEPLLKKALDLNPFCFDCYNGLGSLAYNKKDWKKALEYYNRGIEMDQNNSMIYSNRGLVYENLADEEKNEKLNEKYLKRAIEDLTRAQELAPTDTNIEGHIMRVTEKSEPMKKVKEMYELKIIAEPENPVIIYQYGVYLAKQGLYNEAVTKFKWALEIDKYYISARVDLGGAYLKLRQEEKALKEFKQSLKYDPNNEKAKKGIEMIQKALASGKIKLKENENDSKKNK